MALLKTQQLSLTTSAEHEADSDPRAPLCPLPECRQPMIPHTHQIIIGPDLIDEFDCWVCLNVAAHGLKPNTAAIWLDAELALGAMTEAEVRALELVIRWEATQ